MSNTLTNNLNFNQNQAENLVLHNLPGVPSSPVPGQIYYDSSSPKQRAYYWSPTGNSGAPGWVLLDNPTVANDNYVTNAVFNSASGNLTLERNGGLVDIVTNLDGRYIQGNQSITLSGHITGTGTTAITTTLQPTSISDQTDATLGGNDEPTGTSYFLLNQDGNLKKYLWSDLENYIDSTISSTGTISAYAATVSNGSNPTLTHTITTSTGPLTATTVINGTVGEVEVTGVSNALTIGLPDDVSITNDLVVGGNLTVQGTTTTLNTTELLVEDNLITLNSGATGVPTANAGIEIERGSSTNTSIQWNETTDRWTFTNDGTTYFNIPIPSEYTAYVHPTQAAINIDGSGLQFVQDVTVNTLGHVTAVSLGTIPNASTTTVGVVRLTTLSETTGNNLATTPDTVNQMIQDAIAAAGTSQVYKTTISPTNNSTSTITHNLGTEDLMFEFYNTTNGQRLIVDARTTGLNTADLVFGNIGGITSIRVLIRTV